MEDKQHLEANFMTTAKFSTEVEILVNSDSMSYIDAIIHFCDKNEIELETVSKLISKPLKEKLKHEAQQLNFIKKTSKAKLMLV
jgi:ribosomal protein S12 methylthiotransferase accessory factor YcaO